jgi:hypothetical protein
MPKNSMKDSRTNELGKGNSWYQTETVEKTTQKIPKQLGK